MICPRCKHEMPDSLVGCWYCGEILDPRLRKLMNSPDESQKKRRNSTFLNREKKTPKRRKKDGKRKRE